MPAQGENGNSQNHKNKRGNGASGTRGNHSHGQKKEIILKNTGIQRKSKGGNASSQAPALSHNQLLIMGVAVLIVIVMALFFGMRSCASSNPERSLATEYDWSCLSTDSEGRYVYFFGDTSLSRQGIDVSELQGDINWKAVSKDGIEFAMIRCGYRGSLDGVLYEDATFKTNCKRANANKIDVGLYFFSQDTTEDEARESAQYCIKLAKGKSIDGPIAYDFETGATANGRADDISNEQRSANARAFCETIENAGYDAVIYGNTSDLSLLDADLLEEYGIWQASYDAVPEYIAPFEMWQYSDTGTVDGIDGSVDLDIQIFAE